ncbi:MAG: ABC transporter permease [Ignavibacteriales bacterium]|nr:ABC transporter permease [Ignavibacteriales bacterium]
MKFTLYIAKRYLLAKKEAGFITVISLISIIGVTIGVAALIVVLSVFNGFNSLVTEILVGFDPHVRIQKTKATTSADIEKLNSFLVDQDGIIGKSGFVSGKGMIISKKTTKVVYIRGLEPDKIGTVSGVQDKLVIGNSNFADKGVNEIVLGFNLADKMGVGIDDSIYIVTATGAHEAVVSFIPPELHTFRIIGIYESNNKDYDGLYSFTTVEAAQRIFKSPFIHGFDLRLNSIDGSQSLQRSINEKFDSTFNVQTWFDLHKDLYSVMQVERWTAFIILTLIIGVASFNLMGSLTMTVIEKTRDIGILKAMGAKDNDILAIFRFEGLIVGIVGSLFGLILGYVVCQLQINFHLFALDPNVYIIPAIPIDMRLSDFIIIPIATLVLCFGAAYFPSKRASNLLPSDAVRWE